MNTSSWIEVQTDVQVGEDGDHDLSTAFAAAPADAVQIGEVACLVEGMRRSWSGRTPRGIVPYRPVVEPAVRRGQRFDPIHGPHRHLLMGRHASSASSGRALVKDIEYLLDVNSLHREKETKELGSSRSAAPTAHPGAAAARHVLQESDYGVVVLIDEVTGVRVSVGMMKSQLKSSRVRSSASRH